MKQSRTKLAKAIADRSLKNGSSPKLSQEVAAYLLDEGRVDELDSLLRDVEAEWAAAGYVEVLAYSAHELDTRVKSEIEREAKKLYPAAKKVIITSIHDPEVIGGVRLMIANNQLDLSIEAKLNKFKQLTAGND
jgi:F0F1-type ATP synthase delta subunit